MHASKAPGRAARMAEHLKCGYDHDGNSNNILLFGCNGCKGEVTNRVSIALPG